MYAYICLENYYKNLVMKTAQYFPPYKDSCKKEDY